MVNAEILQSPQDFEEYKVADRSLGARMCYVTTASADQRSFSKQFVFILRALVTFFTLTPFLTPQAIHEHFQPIMHPAMYNKHYQYN